MSIFNPNISKLTLKSQCVSLILSKMINDTLKNNKISNKSILLLDKKASKIISSYITMTDCLNCGLYSIESLFKSRKAFPNLSAIYLIFPNQKNIDLVIKDIKNKLYKYYHIFFIENIKENLIEKFLKKNIINKIKTFKEIYINFLCVDHLIYQFNYFDNFNSLFMLMNKSKKKNYKEKIELISDRLLNIIKVMNFNPNIVYFNLDKNCKEIAECLWEKLDYKKNKTKMDNNIILITSRLLDLTGPLLFDLSYNNLLFEKFKEKNSSNNNTLKLNSSTIDLNKDPLYYKYKSMTLPKVLQNLSEDLNDFMQTDASKIKDKKNLKNLNAMENVLKDYNEYKYITNLFKTHLKLGEVLNNYVKENNLLNIIDYQNNILCGINSEGKKIKNKEILKSIENEIKNDNINNKDLIKLLSILNYYNLDLNYNLEEIVEKINDLNENININKKNFNLIKFFDKENTGINENDLKDINKDIINFRKKNIFYTDETEKEDKRYIGYYESKLNTIINLCCKNNLNQNYFTFLSEKKNKFHKLKSKIIHLNDDNIKYVEFDENLPTILLFNFGGLSYYEISSIYKGIKNCEFNYNIIFGGNKLYNSDEYLDDVNNFLSGNEKDFDIIDDDEDEKEIDDNSNKQKKKNININFEEDEDENEIDTMKTKLIKNKIPEKKNKIKTIEMKNNNNNIENSDSDYSD